MTEHKALSFDTLTRLAIEAELMGRGDTMSNLPAEYAGSICIFAELVAAEVRTKDGAAQAPAVPAVDDLAKELDTALEALQWFMRRCDHLQRVQHRMRDPERTMVCDILANGSLLFPEGNRYALAAAPQPEADEAMRKDAELLDWLDQNIFHREMNEWDAAYGGRGDQNMWVLFAPKGVQGTARNIIAAALAAQGGV